MNALEDRLRDAYHAAAETVRPEAVLRGGIRGVRHHGRQPALRSGSRWSPSRLLVPLASAVAVTAVAVVAATQALGPGSGLRTATTYAMPGRFFVALNWIVSGRRTSEPAMFVVSATTSARAAVISLPFPAADLRGVATGDGRTFIVAASGTHPCSTSLYRFRVTADGMPTTMTAFATIPGVIQAPSDVAVSGNGTTVAYDALACGQGSQGRGGLLHRASGHSTGAYLAVVNTATGKTRRWTWRTNTGTGNEHLTTGGAVSLSADGRTVAFGDWVLPTSAAPGTLAQRGHVVARNGEFGRSAILGGGPVSAPDGKTVYFATYRIKEDKPVGRNWQLRAYDVSTGQTRLVRSFPGSSAPGGPVATDPSGRYLLAEYIPSTGSPLTARLVRLDIATGGVTQLNADGWAAIAW